MCDKRADLRVQSNEMVVKERDPFIWLAPHLAGDEPSYREYSERLMRDLKCYFAGNACPQADDMASEVMYRLIRKLGDGEPEGRDTETARRQYVFGIAKFVLKEWRRGPEFREAAFAGRRGDASKPAADGSGASAVPGVAEGGSAEESIAIESDGAGHTGGE